MADLFDAWHSDDSGRHRRKVRVEVMGNTFTLYEQELRSDVYYFGDLVYRGKKGNTHLFAMDDGLVSRPYWRLAVDGDLPPVLANLPRKQERSITMQIGWVAVALLCVAIVYIAVFL